MRSILLVPNTATIPQLSLRIPNYSFACGAWQPVCNVCEDHSPIIEGYSDSIRRHVEVEPLASQSAMNVADSLYPTGEIRECE